MVRHTVYWSKRVKIVPPFIFIQSRIGFESRIDSEWNLTPKKSVSNGFTPQFLNKPHFPTI